MADDIKSGLTDAIASLISPPSLPPPPPPDGEKPDPKPQKYAIWAAVAAVVVALINGGVTFIGWSSAESIRKQAETATVRLEAIEQAASRALPALRARRRARLHRTSGLWSRCRGNRHACRCRQGNC